MYDVFRHKLCVNEYWNGLPQDSDSYFVGHPLPCLDNLPSSHLTENGGCLGTEKNKWRAKRGIRLPPSCCDSQVGVWLQPWAGTSHCKPPTFQLRGFYFLAVVSIAERACLGCASISLPTFWATGVVASLECLLILVFRGFFCLDFFFPSLFSSQASVSTVLCSSAPCRQRAAETGWR